MQRSQNASDSTSYTRCTPEGSKQRTESQKFLFINRYSVDQNRKSHGPDRQTVGAHVQRAVRQEKCTTARKKLRSAISGDMQFRYRSRDTTDVETLIPSRQFSASEHQNFRCGCCVAKSRALAQAACNSIDQRLDSSSRQALEEKLEKASLLLEKNTTATVKSL